MNFGDMLDECIYKEQLHEDYRDNVCDDTEINDNLSWQQQIDALQLNRIIL
jgi:hypothetical protein